jgi:hypothetical protein
MTLDNMVSFFNNDPQIGEFMTDITMTFNPTITEIAHIRIISLFATGEFDVEHMLLYKETYKNNKCGTDEFIDEVLNTIIDDYNTKYLDENYVHDINQ